MVRKSPTSKRMFSRRGVIQGLGIGCVAFPALTEVLQENQAQQEGRSEAVERISADPDQGFNFPYLIYVPPNAKEVTGPLLLEPVNSGTPSDRFQDDVEAAQRTIENGPVRTISDQLNLPVIVPVFPNPRTGPYADAFTQYLDVETMDATTGDLAGLDTQILAMADDARRRLSERDIDTTDELGLNGFSASGNFVNKLAALHPEQIGSVTAGAINGTAILPREEIDGQQLNYQIGINNLDALTGSEFDRGAWQDIDQYLYIGREERRPIDDTIPYPGVWARDHAQTALDVYGQDMQEERMPFCERIYAGENSPTRFDVLDGVGHTYTEDSIRRSVGVHAQRANISVIETIETATTAEPTITVGGVAASESLDKVEIRVFDQSGEDRTQMSATIPTGQYHERTVTVDGEIAEPTVAIVPAETPVLDTAIVSTTVSSPGEIAFGTTAQSGDTEVEVEYELTPEYDSTTILSVYTEADQWSRIGLARLDPGESGTETFSLPTAEPGVPFEAGDEIELWIHPTGVNLSRSNAILTTTTTVVGEGGSVSVANEPTTDDTQCLLEIELADRFETPATLDAIGPDGTRVSIGVVQPGTAGAQTLSLPGDISRRVGEPVEISLEDPASKEDTLDTAVLNVLSTDVDVTVDGKLVAGTNAIDVRYNSTESAGTPEKVLEVVDEAGESLASASIAAESSGSTTTSVELPRQLQLGEQLNLRITAETGEYLAESAERVTRTQTAEIGVGSRVMGGDPVVEVESTLTAEFQNPRGRTRLFAEDLTGTFGAGLGYPERGGKRTETHRFSGLNVTTDTLFEPGRQLEFRMFPRDWRRLSDVVALHRTIVEGATIEQFPEETASYLTVQVGYGETREGTGTLRLTADGTDLMERPVLPGTRGTSTIQLSERGFTEDLTAGTPISVTLLDAEGARIQHAKTVVAPATLNFTSPPTALETTLTLSYDVAEIAGAESLSIRAYPEHGSSYGIHVTEVPQDTAEATTFSVDRPAVGIPFEAGTQLTVAMVTLDDPFAKEPLAMTTATVESGNSVPDGSRYDLDGDGEVGFTDVLGAIEAYNSPKGSAEREMSFTDVLEAISRYNR